MNETAYCAVTKDEDGAGIWRLAVEFLRLTGRDRASFLQGQISNDVLAAEPGHLVPACLLNNTGHLSALLDIHVLEDSLLVVTDTDRVALVEKSLNRFIVRERVEIVREPFKMLTVQGPGTDRIVSSVLSEAGSDSTSPISYYRPRFTASHGTDVIVCDEAVEHFQASLLSVSGAYLLDDETAEVLRIEAGDPKWGAELTEAVIPLEAGLDRTISYTKGCYLGQEVIARIHSRGHTNRSLVRLKLSGGAGAESPLVAVEGEKAGETIGRITSFAESPRFGCVALGYVRNEFADPGTMLRAGGCTAEVTPIPFTNERPTKS